MPSRAPHNHEIVRDRPGRYPRTGEFVKDDDQVTRETPVLAPESNVDRVTSHRHVRHSVENSQIAQVAHVVFPDARQVLSLVAPGVVMTMSIVLAFAVASMTGANSAWFLAPLVVPGLILGAFRGGGAGSCWRESVGINLGTMLILFPLLIISKSAVRVPYLDMAHGTVFAAMLSTAAVVVALAGVALAAAWIAREDAESSAMLFLPAALMVPLLTSATEFAELSAALLVAGSIFVVATILTVFASMLPSSYVVFVAPLAVAAEVLFVTMVRQDRIFPVGVNEAGMVLFATVVVVAIALVVVLPSLSAWFSRIDQLRLSNRQRMA